MSEVSAPISTVPASVDRDVYNAFVKSARLVALETELIRGQRLRPGISPQTNYDLASELSISASHIFYRYTVTANLLGEDGEPVALVEVAIVVVFEFQSEHVDQAAAEHFGASSVFLMVAPNLREAVSSTALRLGYSGVTMPMVTLNPDVDRQT